MDTEDVQPVPNIDHLLSNIGRTGLLGEASGERRLLSANRCQIPAASPVRHLAVTLSLRNGRVDPDAAFTLKAEVGKLGAVVDQREMEAFFF